MTWFGCRVIGRPAPGLDPGSAGKARGESKYLVATGAVVFTQHAESAPEALRLVKNRLRAAYESQASAHDPNRLSRALVESFAQGRLNFIVMDGERTRLICGEYAGEFQQPVTRRLTDSLRHLIPPELELKRHMVGCGEFYAAKKPAAAGGSADAGLCA